MLLNKIAIVLAILTTVFTMNDLATVKSTAVVITEKSSLTVKGTSNVNSFSCVFDINDIINPMPIVYHNGGDKITFQKTTLVLDNTSFDCGGRGINKDFQKTLKTEEHPQILLSLKEIKPTENPTTVEATVAIEIAGLSHNYVIPVEIGAREKLQVAGRLNVQISDYKLKAPKKLFGMITVDDDLEIVFRLEIKEQKLK